MMVDSRIFSKDFTKLLIRNNSKRMESGMNTDLLTIWLLKLLNSKVVMFGPAKTMMVMSNLILLLKVIYDFIQVMDHSV